MQTSPWDPRAATPSRGSWWATAGWYVAGVAATLALVRLAMAFSRIAPGAAVYLDGLLVAGSITAGVLWCLRLRGRDRAAFWAGVVTPVVAVAVVVAWFVIELATDPNAFTF
jgi:hypothetical protein